MINVSLTRRRSLLGHRAHPLLMSPFAFLVFVDSVISSWAWPRPSAFCTAPLPTHPLLCHRIRRPSMACLEALAEAHRLHPSFGRSHRLGHSPVNIAALRHAQWRTAVALFLSYNTSLRANLSRDWQWEGARPGIGIGWNPRIPMRQAVRLEARSRGTQGASGNLGRSHARPRRPRISPRAPNTFLASAPGPPTACLT